MSGAGREIDADRPAPARPAAAAGERPCAVVLRSYNETPVPYTVKIYTRTGDTGETSLFGGTRVSKSDARVDAYGEVDELNAWLGFARASLGARPDGAAFADIGDALVQIQRDLFALGARLADPGEKISARVTKAALHDADVDRLEQLIDRLEADLPALAHFILAGGVEAGAGLHLARAVCRRAERRMVTLQPAVDLILIRYINRLSDLLFVMARAVNHRARAPETQW
jgi:cob(I)alamin adenosyltransferase